MRRTIVSWRGLVALLVVGAAVSAAGPAPVKGEWRYYAGDNASTKYSPLDQINSGNVSKLRVAWRRTQLDAEFLTAHPKMRI